MQVMLLAMFAILMPLAVPASADRGDPTASREDVVAMFEGRPIDLTLEWGAAKACAVWASDTVVECFASETELLERASELRMTYPTGETSLASSTCSYSLRLYDGTNYSGSALYLYQRTTWINLSNYGWANRTSSYKIGACSAYFADYSDGGGSWYPTSSTQAWDQASSMNSGWNNRVSSVYIS